MKRPVLWILGIIRVNLISISTCQPYRVFDTSLWVMMVFVAKVTMRLMGLVVFLARNLLRPFNSCSHSESAEWRVSQGWMDVIEDEI